MVSKAEIMKQLFSQTDWECSNSPEGNWHQCCVQHDYDYVEGTSKWVADMKLAKCISSKGHPGVAAIYWTAVTLFGWNTYLKYKKEREEAGIN